MSALKDLPTQEAPECAHSFVAPYSRVCVSASDLDDHIGMRVEQLAALLRVIPVADYSTQMLSLAGRLADELNEQWRRRQSGEVVAAQLAELLLRIQGEDGPCHLLWLAQQFADEVAAAISAIDLADMRGAP